jgi:Flp pilus assembly protein TadG
MSPEMHYLWILVRSHLDRVRDDERGVSAVELVIITGILIALAGTVGWAIYDKVNDKAGDISL